MPPQPPARTNPLRRTEAIDLPQFLVGMPRPSKGHLIALVALARDFVSNVLYDMWHSQRPFFLCGCFR